MKQYILSICILWMVVFTQSCNRENVRASIDHDLLTNEYAVTLVDGDGSVENTFCGVVEKVMGGPWDGQYMVLTIDGYKSAGFIIQEFDKIKEYQQLMATKGEGNAIWATIQGGLKPIMAMYHRDQRRDPYGYVTNGVIIKLYAKKAPDWVAGDPPGP